MISGLASLSSKWRFSGSLAGFRAALPVRLRSRDRKLLRDMLIAFLCFLSHTHMRLHLVFSANPSSAGVGFFWGVITPFKKVARVCTARCSVRQRSIPQKYSNEQGTSTSFSVGAYKYNLVISAAQHVAKALCKRRSGIRDSDPPPLISFLTLFYRAALFGARTKCKPGSVNPNELMRLLLVSFTCPSLGNGLTNCMPFVAALINMCVQVSYICFGTAVDVRTSRHE